MMDVTCIPSQRSHHRTSLKSSAVATTALRFEAIGATNLAALVTDCQADRLKHKSAKMKPELQAPEHSQTFSEQANASRCNDTLLIETFLACKKEALKQHRRV